MGTLITPGGTDDDGKDLYRGECHLWEPTDWPCSCWLDEWDDEWPSKWSWLYSDFARVVVDLGVGGRSGRAAAEAACFDPHVLVLTHSDHDHIGGFDDFAEHWPTSCREVWVPHDWWFVTTALAAVRTAGQQPTDVMKPEDLRALDQDPASAQSGEGPASGENDAAGVAQEAGQATNEEVMAGGLGVAEEGSFGGGLSPEEVRAAMAVVAAAAEEAAAALEAAEEDPALKDAVAAAVEKERDVRRLGSWSPLAGQEDCSAEPPPNEGDGAPGDTEEDAAGETVADAAWEERDGQVLGSSSLRSEHIGRPEEIAGDVVDKASKLVKILRTAVGKGARIRFFTPDDDKLAAGLCSPWRSEGRPGVATIINAVEKTPVLYGHSDPALNLLLAMRLTVQNRRALATFLWDWGCGHTARGWGRPDRPWGVLVWSDGGGESCLVNGTPSSDLVPWEHVSLMTAPHHGSANTAHDAIWQARDDFQASAGRNIPVVLAGGSSGQGVSGHYLDRRQTPVRACQKCRHRKVAGSRTVVADAHGPFVRVWPQCW